MSPYGSAPQEWKAIDKEAQRRLWRRVRAKLKELGVSDAQGMYLLRLHLNNMGVKSTKELTPVTYRTVCNLVDRWDNDTFQPQPDEPAAEAM
jgi:hypothetical protein